jgi:uncharacterized membrane protein
MPRPAHALAVLLAGAGVSHFAVPRFYDPMIPSRLPGHPRTWTYGSGIVELTVAAALAVPRTRRVGGLAAATLFIAVFPGNVQMAVDARRGPVAMKAATLARLPLQVPLILAAWRVYRRSPPARTATIRASSASS